MEIGRDGLHFIHYHGKCASSTKSDYDFAAWIQNVLIMFVDTRNWDFTLSENKTP